MLAHSDLQRSIKSMSFSLARAIRKRADEPRLYGLTEREVQFQYEIIGSAGNAPTETQIPIQFDLTFFTDSGNQRDSTLDRPQLRTGFEFDYRPKGLIPYVHIDEWLFDDDFNIVGAVAAVGIHCPVEQSASSAKYKGAVHIAFQGWGLPADQDGDYDAGGSVDFTNATGGGI